MRRVTRTTACEALGGMDERQRLLRTAYISARYGWPETLASAWETRPQTFDGPEPGCPASRFLDALTSPGDYRS
jgi:hypothetical protein